MTFNRITIALRSLYIGGLAMELPKDANSALALLNIGISLGLALGLKRDDFVAYIDAELPSIEKVHALLNVPEQKLGAVALDEALADAKRAATKGAN